MIDELYSSFITHTRRLCYSSGAFAPATAIRKSGSISEPGATISERRAVSSATLAASSQGRAAGSGRAGLSANSALAPTDLALQASNIKRGLLGACCGSASRGRQRATPSSGRAHSTALCILLLLQLLLADYLKVVQWCTIARSFRQCLAKNQLRLSEGNHEELPAGRLFGRQDARPLGGQASEDTAATAEPFGRPRHSKTR